MLITSKAGFVNAASIFNRAIDVLSIEWYEANKRIMHKQTRSGRNVSLKFLKENPDFRDGDIIWQNDDVLVVIEIKPFDAIVIKPATILVAASVCYEIGNKHLPLFYENDELLVPYDLPLLKLLEAAGYDIKVEERKLINHVKTTVSPHIHNDENTSLFTKILKLTTSS